MRPHWQVRVLLIVTAALLLALGTSPPASAASLVRISTDPYTNPDSAHKTEVEPDTFAFGNTIVSTFQVGRFFNGGATNTGFAVSHDDGTHWKHGFLPGLTVAEGGPYDRASDPTVAYDANHRVWLISSLARPTAGAHGAGRWWWPPVGSWTRTGPPVTTRGAVRSTAAATPSSTMPASAT